MKHKILSTSPVNWVRSFFIEQDGDKETIRKDRLFLVLALLFVFLILVTLLGTPDEDQSFVRSATKSLVPTEDSKISEQVPQVAQEINTILEHSKEVEQKNITSHNQMAQMDIPSDIKYHAKQVIMRENDQDNGNHIPIGTNFIGKLLTAIDTRDTEQLVKVILPYGGSFKGRGYIPKNTTLLGNIKYPGKGEKLFIHFIKGITSEGAEFDLKAQALSTKDYSTGIQGEYHGTAGIRVATTLGLTMVSGMTDIMTAKEVLGNSEVVTPKSTMRNALYHGTSKVTEMEAERQASELKENNVEYVTVDSDKDLIISLTETFKGIPPGQSF